MRHVFLLSEDAKKSDESPHKTPNTQGREEERKALQSQRVYLKWSEASTKPSNSGGLAMLKKVRKRRKTHEIRWIRTRRFQRKMAKEAKVRRMRSEEGFIGREGEKGEVPSRRFISRPFVSRRFISESRAHSQAVGWESLHHHLTVERV